LRALAVNGIAQLSSATVRARDRWLGWSALVLLLLGTAVPAIHDPPYWDANVYVNQGRYVADHGLALDAYRHPPDVLKPPLYASLVLGGVSALTRAPWALHVATWLFALLTLWATAALTRALGGDGRAQWIAGALCATSPLMVGQTGLVQSDLAMTALATWAWVMLLDGRVAGWLLLAAGAVLTKESAYFLCAPALALLWLRAAPSSSSSWTRAAATVRRAWLAAWPGVVLLGWLAALQALTGNAVPRLNRDALKPNYLVDALIHQLVEGGRLPLAILAALALRRRVTGEAHGPTGDEPAADARLRSARWATAVGIAALPLLFFAPLPRYMLAGLPWLCALAAQPLAAWRPRSRVLAVAALVATQVIGWFGPSWHANGGHHLDRNLRYRRLLATQEQAVRAVAAERPRRVLAAFPIYFAAIDPPFEGWLDAPLPTTLAGPAATDASLCAADFFFDPDQTAPLDDVRARLQGRLRPWRTFGSDGIAVRVWRIDCN
jgi:hypothetical protein